MCYNFMGITESLMGIIPPAVAGGVTLKFTKAALGSSKGKGKSKRKGKKNSPW